MILNALTSIGFILASDYLLDKLNLKERFPRFSNFIKFRARVNQATI